MIVVSSGRNAGRRAVLALLLLLGPLVVLLDRLDAAGELTLFVLAAAAPGLHGDPDRRSLAELTLPLAALLLIVRVVVTRAALRRQRQLYTPPEFEAAGWPLPVAFVVLGLATLVTAFLTETLVGT